MLNSRLGGSLGLRYPYRLFTFTGSIERLSAFLNMGDVRDCEVLRSRRGAAAYCLRVLVSPCTCRIYVYNIHHFIKRREC